MKENPEKCHLLMNVNRPATIKIGEHTMSNSYCETLHSVKIDSQLNFKNRLETTIKKTTQQVQVLAEIMCVFKRKILMNACLSRLNLATVHF